MKKDGGSILLRHLSSSCRQLARLYADAGSGRAFPSDVETVAGGHEMMQFYADEIGFNKRALDVWRAHQHTKATFNDDPPKAFSHLWRGGGSSHHDIALATTAVHDLHATLSPFLQLCHTGQHVSNGSGDAVGATDSQFVATRDIAAGMFLMSVPTECALMSEAPVSDEGDTALENALHVDDLAAQLWCDALDPSATHHRYAQYIRETVTPPRNLPFLRKDALETPNAVPLWAYFHEEMQCQPRNAMLREKLSPEEYLWYVSVVHSRRSGLTMIIPLVDKLNHGSEPNAYFTMARPNAFCGLDVLDNMLAGVDADLLCTPYIHVFAINPIAKGTPITISYSTADPKDAQARDVWRLNWGFIPDRSSTYTEAELKSLAGIVAARRVEQLSSLFPLET